MSNHELLQIGGKSVEQPPVVGPRRTQYYGVNKYGGKLFKQHGNEPTNSKRQGKPFRNWNLGDLNPRPAVYKTVTLPLKKNSGIHHSFGLALLLGPSGRTFTLMHNLCARNRR